MVTNVLPALYLMWLDETSAGDICGCESTRMGTVPVPVESIQGFLSSRQLSGRPVTFVDTQDKFSEADRKPLYSGVA